jgi:hypothetical protein
MSFYLIKGTFHVVNYMPDGDSVRFQAEDNNNWKKLSGPSVEWNARDHVQLRFEAIDALETHFSGHHQPTKFAFAAREALLSNLGIKNVDWNDKGSKVISATDGTKGYILARVVESHRRPVAFVFSGETNKKDGSEVNLTPKWLKKVLIICWHKKDSYIPHITQDFSQILEMNLQKLLKMEGKRR